MEEIDGKKVAVVCHDAGAANLLIPWLKQWNLNIAPFIKGPATRLWQCAFPNVSICDSLDEALNGATRLISGTGWASTLEHDARVLARSIGIRSTAVLDHWVNYKMRFERGGVVQLPDELWVADEWAMKIARKEFPQIPSRQFDNLYLQTQVAQISPTTNSGTVLYVLEPVRHTWGRNQEGEYQALNYALEHIDRLCTNKVREIILRPHPSESLDKYSCYASVDPRVKIDSSLTLAQAISFAELVVGVESFALIIAHSAGRETYSSLPPWAPALRLPHPGIQQIRYLNWL